MKNNQESTTPKPTTDVAVAMLQAAKESTQALRDKVSSVRYGKVGEILFEFNGKTYTAPEPADVMPAKNTTGTNDEASRSWALSQVLCKKAKLHIPTD